MLGKEAIAKIETLDKVIEKRFNLNRGDLDFSLIARNPDFYEEYYCNQVNFDAVALKFAGVPDRLARQYRRYGEAMIELTCDMVIHSEKAEELCSEWMETHYNEVVDLLTKIAAC